MESWEFGRFIVTRDLMRMNMESAVKWQRLDAAVYERAAPLLRSVPHWACPEVHARGAWALRSASIVLGDEKQLAFGRQARRLREVKEAEAEGRLSVHEALVALLAVRNWDAADKWTCHEYDAAYRLVEELSLRYDAM